MGQRKGRRHGGRASRGGSRSGRGRGGSRGGRRGGNSFLSRVEDDIDNFSRRDGLSDDFVSLQERRNTGSVLKLNKKLKVSKLHQLNDMVDLNRGDFNDIEEMSVNSMMYHHQSNLRRRNRNENSMYNEVRYTNNHREELLNKSFRKLKIEFVKAKEVYDPSKDLLNKLYQKQKNETEDLNKPTIVDVEEEIFRENEIYQEDDDDEDGDFSDTISEGKDEDILDESSADDDIASEIGIIVENGDHTDNEILSPEVNIEISKDSDEHLSHQDSSNSDDDIEMQKLMEETEQLISKPKVNFEQLKHKNKRSKIQFVDDNEEKTFDLSYDEGIDDSELDIDDAIVINSDDDLEDNLIIDDDECENTLSKSGDLQIGRYLGTMKQTKNGEQFIELPTMKRKPGKKKTEKTIYVVSDDNDSMDIHDVTKHVNKKLYGATDVESVEDRTPEDEEPEFGFLEEDYVSFDVTNIKIDNIRVGAEADSKQYYVQAPYLFGFDDFQWLNRADFLDFLVENGFPEKRFNAFIKSITSHLTDPQDAQREEVFDEDQIYISDSSEENDSEIEILSTKKRASSKKAISISDDDDDAESELDEDLMEGIEDLLTMHKNSSKSSHFDPLEVNTKSIKIKGKRKRPQVEVNTEISPEFQEFLNEKYLVRKQNKKEKKEEREFARKNNAYMLTKYPYLMEMDEIMDEFKEFHADTLRETLRFPPMDFHVNMVLKMISEAFGFNSRKVGKGKKQYLEVKKPRKSKMREPDWGRLKKLANKRNVCFRMDVELSREEKRELKRIKGGNSAVEKMKNKGRGNFSYKEGEIVGANAKEIDSSSIGRKLLEKMGWNAGDSLGPDDNKGITEPIKVVVKTSKRGIQ